MRVRSYYHAFWQWKRKCWFFVCILLVVPACDAPTSKVSQNITQQFESSARTFVNLTEVLSSEWEKVCILGPYSDNKATEKTLGFKWDVESASKIATNDSIALLLFVKDKNVIESVEHPRRDGDFTNLSRKCFAREMASFHHQTNPPKGWPGLFPVE